MKLDTRLDDLGDLLERSIATEISGGEHRASERRTARTRPARPRILAGGTLGLAGVAAAVAIVLGATGATTPAYAITQKTDGTVLLKINLYGPHTLGAADSELIARYHETVLFAATPTGSHSQDGSFAAGPSTSPAPVDCTPTADPYAPGDPTPSGPRIQLLIGKDNTVVIPSGNTGAGTEHLVSCSTLVATPGANSGSGDTGS